MPSNQLLLRSQGRPSKGTPCAGRADDLTRSRTVRPAVGKSSRNGRKCPSARSEPRGTVRVTSADLGRWLLDLDTSTVAVIRAGSVGQLVHSTKGVTWLCRH